ncbi:MAG TPA: hypothetical protein VGS17_10280 [Candidatus Limnocylindria bacterium]|nr:hypothetical protein [Candidatus Limnocylindria bacterium]
MTRARLTFPQGDPIEFPLEEVAAFGPDIAGFRPWLGAVFASAEGRWLIRVGDDEVLGFRRTELKRVRATPEGAELTLGDSDEPIPLREVDVRSYGPEPKDVRSWLGRLAHGQGDAWIRFIDGHELRFAIGNGPHIRFLEPTDTLPEGGIRLPLA